MRKVFDETRIDGMTLANRLVRSATWEGMCEEDGRPTPKLAAYYAKLAKGGVGLIITGYTFIRPDGKQLPGQMGIHDESFADQMRALTRAVHEAGGKDLPSTGSLRRQCPPRRLTGCSARRAVGGGGETSMPKSRRSFPLPTSRSLIRLFGEGAKSAKEYGFDAVQLHAAHGYLINQFLSPLTNRRGDAYGGSVENRSRFLLEAYRSVRSAVGKDFPVLVKLNGSDNLDGGLELEDALFAARALDEEGIERHRGERRNPRFGRPEPGSAGHRPAGTGGIQPAAGGQDQERRQLSGHGGRRVQDI